MLRIKGIEKLNKDQRFFVENFFNMTEKLYKRDTEVFNFALELQEKNAKEIFNMIAKLMLNYNIDKTCMNLAPKDIRKLKKEFFKKIDNAFADEYRRENSTLTTTLLEVGKNKYNYSAYLLELGVDFNVKKISDTKLNKILKKTIQGETYSNRIYNNKDSIAKELKKEIKKFLNGETNCNNISKILKKKFKLNKDNSSRLISDQIARVQDEVNEQFFKDNSNFEDLLYCATLDKHTCTDCAEFDGRVYKKNDDSRPSIPKHVRCRCTYILIPYESYKPKRRIDNITKETIDYKSYDEWVKEKFSDTGGGLGKRYKGDFNRENNHADTYYKSIRKRTDDIKSIAKNTGLNINTIKKIKSHVFFNEYDLMQGYGRFAPDYNMAISWQRLIEGKNIKNSDIVLLHHERLESQLMNKYNYKYEEAHKITCMKYDYVKALREE